MTKYWIGVVPKEYVNIAVEGNFCQVCNGKKQFIDKLAPGDHLIYYSPKLTITTKEKYQKFIAAGTVVSADSFQVEMLPGFTPYRKRMTFETIKREVPLAEIRDENAWKSVRANLRFGLMQVSESLFVTIYDKMMTPGENHFNK
ncbi:EVE domain-containing protein [Lentilactobacillus kisonensis]|uniref:EVE domain-containing protein n=1 Tax=Lentilactobacillus kisonensis TaxID=481722 RepID=UPI00030995B3|nr:EVE domain-containing protein [Lentilactobacillus kisonensis]